MPGGVPDADDTAGALLALYRLENPAANPRSEVRVAAELGCRWLLDLQNRDGGIPRVTDLPTGDEYGFEAQWAESPRFLVVFEGCRPEGC
jgi:hypothetical protein